MPTLNSLHSLEPRRLLSFPYSMVDLGIVNQPLGSAVLDLNDAGALLTPTAIWVLHNGKGQKVDIDPNSFIARKLGSGENAGGESLSTHQAGSVEAHKPHGRSISKVIGPLTLQANSIANAINRHDLAVGRMKSTGSYHAFLVTYEADNLGIRHSISTDLTAQFASQSLEIDNAIDISGSNQILLTGFDSQTQSSNAAIATLSSRGWGYLQLPAAEHAFDEILPREINDIGQAAGTIESGSHSRATLWTTSRHGVQITSLPTLGGSESEAMGLNNLGLVAGWSLNGRGRQRAMLYDQSTGKSIDVNTLADTLGLSLRIATSVNNNGQIAAEGIDTNGNVHAVLLSPTDPYPALHPGISMDANHFLIINGTPGNDKIVLAADPQDGQQLTLS
jgi:hypothetical protein